MQKKIVAIFLIDNIEYIPNMETYAFQLWIVKYEIFTCVFKIVN